MRKLLSLISLLGVLAMGSTPYDTLPMNIPGLTAWYDFSNAGSVTASGGTISQINDLSGNGNTLKQATTGNQPAYTATINGLNVATFNGSSDFLATATTNTFATGSNPSYTIAVAYPTTATSSALNAVVSYGGSGGDSRFMGKSHNGLSASIFTGSTTNTTNTMSTSTLSIEIGAFGSTSSTIILNGNTSAQGTQSHTLSTGTGTVFNMGYGGTVGGTYWSGPIGEAIVVNAALTTANEQLLEGYLACKWGIQSVLPTTHPFRNICPYFPNPIFVGIL